MRAYHNNISHSLMFGVPVALLIAGIFQRMYQNELLAVVRDLPGFL
jgi:hypothetical protein